MILYRSKYTPCNLCIVQVNWSWLWSQKKGSTATPWESGAGLADEQWENGKCLWVKANEVSSHSVLCCFDWFQALSFQDLRSYYNCSNLSKNFSSWEASGQGQIYIYKKKNQSPIRMACFGTHILLCFRPIQQDLCPQQNSLLIVSDLIIWGKICLCSPSASDCTSSAQANYQKAPFFWRLQHSLGSTAAKQTTCVGRFP